MKILQVTGYKNSGKTTTIRKMVEWLKSEGRRVAVIKHHHLDDVLVDAGVDSGRFTASGADYSVFNTPGLSMQVAQVAPDVPAQLEDLERKGMDIVLIEGYKTLDYDKIFMVYSFREGHKNVDNTGITKVLKTFDVRYDGERIMNWFKEWSTHDETV